MPRISERAWKVTKEVTHSDGAQATGQAGKVYYRGGHLSEPAWCELPMGCKGTAKALKSEET